MDLALLKELRAKKTQGEWSFKNIGYSTLFEAKSFIEPAVAALWNADNADALYVVALVNADLVTEVERLQEELSAVTRVLNEVLGSDENY